MQPTSSGFTLIETMVAIALLMVALVAPMSLASQSLASAYYSRDQITASYLAQEGIEVVRSVRDANIIAVARGNSGAGAFNGIPLNQPFTVDSLQPTSNAIYTCTGTVGGTVVCPPLMTKGALYGYDDISGGGVGSDCSPSGTTWTSSACVNGDNWTVTVFTRTLSAYVFKDNPDELRISVTVTWRQGSYQQQSFILYEDLYNWVS